MSVGTAAEQRGLTLLELLVAMTLASVVVVIMAMALRMGVQAWTKGKEKNRRRLVREEVINLLGEELMASGAGGSDPFRHFQGNRHALWFTTHRVPMGSGGGGTFLVFFRYLPSSKALIYGQRFVADWRDVVPPPEVEPQEGMDRELAAKGWDVEVVRPFPPLELRYGGAADLETGPDGWQTRWRRGGSRRPAAVALRVGEEGAQGPWLIFPTRWGVLGE